MRRHRALLAIVLIFLFPIAGVALMGIAGTLTAGSVEPLSSRLLTAAVLSLPIVCFGVGLRILFQPPRGCFDAPMRRKLPFLYLALLMQGGMVLGGPWEHNGQPIQLFRFGDVLACVAILAIPCFAVLLTEPDPNSPHEG